MATISGFQSNTTIHAAFWIYKPDPTVDPVSKVQFIEVNSLQKVEANAAVVLSSVSSVQVTGTTLTVNIAASGGMRSYQQVIFSGMTNALFLNGQVVTITGVTPTTVTATYVATNKWDAALNYVPGESVLFGGVTYYCILANTNQTPPNATYWATTYGPTVEPAGAQVIDTTNRVAYLFYAEQAVSPSQAPLKLDGAVASKFIYDMEALFA